jgi:hypothetical protein
MKIICRDPNDASKTIAVDRGPCVAFDELGNEVAWIVEGQPQYVIVPHYSVGNANSVTEESKCTSFQLTRG